MDFMTAVKTCFSKYVTFSGRAQRSEFWWFVLFVFAVSMALSIVDSVLFGTTTVTDNGFSSSTDTPILSGIFSLAILLPYISVTVRRLHDIDKSGWWYWLFLVPLIGFIILLIWFIRVGTTGSNSYGSDPLGGEDQVDPATLSTSSIPPVDRG